MVEEQQKSYRVEKSRLFTWEELSKLNEKHNAHVAYRGKVHS